MIAMSGTESTLPAPVCRGPAEGGTRGGYPPGLLQHSPSAATAWHTNPERAASGRVKIIYTRGNRTETLASLSTLRKILGRFVRHRVFYEVSSRNKRGHEFFSTKNTFVVGSIEVTSRDYLSITIFDAHCSTHSVEILNPAAMRIYDETPGKGFAVSFLSGAPQDAETRCYLRDEGEEGEDLRARGALEQITLPQLFEYIDEIRNADAPRAGAPFSGNAPPRWHVLSV